MTPTKSTKIWRASVFWIAWMSMCGAISVFGNVHPWYKALSIWWLIPWGCTLGYHFGRKDKRLEMFLSEEEHQPWLYREISDWLGDREYEAHRIRIRMKFKGE